MNTTVKYISLFADALHNMQLFHESLGGSRGTYTSELRDFDRFCVEKYPDTGTLTKNLVLEWCAKRPTEKITTHRTRIVALRKFGKYMCFIGHEAYIMPLNIIAKNEVFDPYIFTDDELFTFFRIIDTMRFSPKLYFADYTLPVFFRIAYGSGLRPSELYHLRRCDVNLRERTLFVYNSKTKRDRLITLTADLSDLCEKYDKIAQWHFPERFWFFHIAKEIKSRKAWFGYHLKKYWKIAKLDKRLGYCPRIYDFRHNYATRILTRWFDDGKDIMTFMPYLSSYMGHIQLHSTMYYVHLLPERLRQNKAFDWNKFEILLPEVPHDKE
jgi:integrase